MASGDPVISFTGYRFYKMDNVRTERTGPALRITAVLSPVDRFGCYPADKQLDKDYMSFLSDSCHTDPIWDEELQPSYYVFAEKSMESALISVKVKLLGSSFSGTTVELYES